VKPGSECAKHKNPGDESLFVFSADDDRWMHHCWRIICPLAHYSAWNMEASDHSASQSG
jgi:hypothetical protein